MPRTERQARLLIVEDNAASRRVVARCLGDYELLEADSGEQALTLLAGHDVDLVLLDLGLPGIDGYDVLEHVKADAAAQTMVIVVTGRGHTDEMVKGFEHLADDYVVKPFHQEELLARVKNALRLKWLQDELREINQNLELEVRERTAQLMAQQQFALLGRNAAQLAHNLNSPLSAILGYLELAINRPDDALKRDLLEKAKDVTGDMAAVIANLLTGVRSRETVVEAVEPLDLNALVRRQVEFWQVDPRFRYQVEAVLELDEPLPPVKSVATDLRQILTNLFDNAVYAMKDRPDAHLWVRTRAVNGEVRLEVADNGPGISPEHLGRIFDPLFTTKPVGEGTGLGLASCYELANASGGRLEVESQLGEGATFRLVLPAAERPTATRGGRAARRR